MRRGPISIEDAARVIARHDAEPWRERLLINQRTGEPKAVFANACAVFREHPDWKGRLAFDEFRLAVIAKGPTPICPEPINAWTDQHDRLAAEWLQREGVLVGLDVAGAAIQTVAREGGSHPVREWLRKLQWDCTPRLDTWLTNYLGVTRSNYAAAVGRKWLIGAVARALRPGAKVDAVLILEGSQGIGKSRALRALAGADWFTDDLADLGTKDAALALAGVWIIELSELAAMTRAEVERVKQFISRQVDRYRPPYGARMIEQPRSCVFAGTTNATEYLKDETGARRFWPLRCGVIDIAGIERDREQLWAEAVERYKAGEPWWLDGDVVTEAQTEAAARFDEDAWHETIAAWVAPRQVVSADQVLEMCLEKKRADWTPADKMRVTRTLRALGFERFQQRDGAERAWRFRRRESNGE